MPIYEYACPECKTEFEKFVQGQAAVTCPRCQSGRVNRRISVVGIRTSGSGWVEGGSGQGGGCCAGGCHCG